MSIASSLPSPWLPTWDDITEDSFQLADMLKKQGNFGGIIGVTRGGMIPACLVAQHLKIKMIDTICIQSYDYQSAGHISVMKQIYDIRQGDGWLVIDDLCDSGRTFAIIRTILPQAHFACLYVKPKGARQADTFVRDVPQDTWIYLPWEAETRAKKIADAA